MSGPLHRDVRLGSKGQPYEAAYHDPRGVTPSSTLQRVLDWALTQQAAAQELGLSERQVRRLTKVLARGQPSLASKRRGKPPNNQYKTPITNPPQKSVAA